MSQIDKLKEDTRIAVFKKMTEQKFKDGEIGFAPIFEEIIFLSAFKQKIFEKMSIAMSTGFKPPFVVLAPISYLSKRSKHLTYPLKFMDSYLYFIPYIKEAIVLESS